MNYFLKGLGSREKVEEYFRKPWNALRDDVLEKMKANYIKEQVQDNLTKNVKATPNDVKKYFKTSRPLPTTLRNISLNFLPTAYHTCRCRWRCR